MNTSCPICRRDFDPLRSRATRIESGRVVVYCSAECRAGFAREEELTPTPPPAETSSTPVEVAPPEPPPPAPRRAYGGKTAAALVLAGAAAAAVAIASTRSGLPPATAAVAIVPAPVVTPPPPPPGPAKADPQQLFTEAKATLTAALSDPSPRIRLLAAMALSRTGDVRALAELGNALEKDPSEIRRVQVAAALARAGDERGPTYLAAQLRSTRREPAPPRRGRGAGRAR